MDVHGRLRHDDLETTTRQASGIQPRWCGWKRAVDAELVALGGALPWRELCDAVVARYRAYTLGSDASGIEQAHQEENQSVLHTRVLASIPASYLSKVDELVRLPRRQLRSFNVKMRLAAFLKRSIDAALRAAGGKISWRCLRTALIHKQQQIRRATLSKELDEDEEQMGCRGLAAIPSSYLSREDEYVRLPSRKSDCKRKGDFARLRVAEEMAWKRLRDVRGPLQVESLVRAPIAERRTLWREQWLSRRNTL